MGSLAVVVVGLLPQRLIHNFPDLLIKLDGVAEFRVEIGVV